MGGGDCQDAPPCLSLKGEGLPTDAASTGSVKILMSSVLVRVHEEYLHTLLKILTDSSMLKVHAL